MKVFDWDANKGSLIDKISNTQGTLTVGNGGFKKTDKGLAMEFDGSTTHISLGSLSASGTTQTIVAWVYLSDNTSQNPCIFFGGTALNLEPTQIRYFPNYFAGTALVYGSPLPEGKWYHLVALRNSSDEGKLYINGGLVQTTSSLADINTSSQTSYIGRYSSAYLSGIMCKAMVFNHSFTVQEVNDDYIDFLQRTQLGLVKYNPQPLIKPTDLSNEDGLVAAYIPSYQNIIGNQLIDIAGSNNGTIYGAALTKDGLKFDGVDDYVNCGNDSSLDIATEWSLLAYVKLGDNMSSYHRIVGKQDGSNNCNYGLGIETGTKIGVFFNDGVPFDALYSTLDYNDGLWHSIAGVYDGANLNLYIDGVFISSKSVSVGTITNSGELYIGKNSSVGTEFFEGVISDIKILNYAITPQQALDYHNSFKHLTFRDTAEYEGADLVAKTPVDAISGTGTFGVDEFVMELGDLHTDSNAASIENETDATTGWSADGITLTSDATDPQTGSWSLKGVATSTTFDRMSYNLTTVAGKTYTVKFWAKRGIQGIEQASRAWTGVTEDDIIPITSTTWTEYITTVVATGTTINIRIYSNWTSGAIGDEVYVDNVSITEIPPLPQLTNGTFIRKCLSSGTMAYPSKQAYGVWEFDLYKSGDAGRSFVTILTTDIGSDYSAGQGYSIYMYTDERLYLSKINDAWAGDLFGTAASYISINTYYRLKVVRLASEGVFKDIETLQVSDFVNELTIYGYTSFISNGRYGYSAISDGSSYQVAGTADEIYYVNTVKYLVELNINLKSGTAPNIRLSGTLTSGTASNVVDLVNGRNSIILTATSSDIGRIVLNNNSTATDYKVSGLTIRRIYPKDTFAVFIKGGAFGDLYTLVDTTGGSGSNPVTDSTYTTSEYMVLDLDTDDEILNIKQYNQD